MAKPQFPRGKDPKRTARERSTAACLAHVEARDLFWALALARGWTPRRSEKRHITSAKTLLPEPPPEPFLLEGSNPGLWPEEAQKTREWRAWKKARDAAWTANWGLVPLVVMKRIPARRDGAEREDSDQEDVWSEARIALLRGIDLWDPARTTSPSTYLTGWVKSGAGKVQQRAQREAKRKEALKPDDSLCSERELDYWAAEDRWIAALDADDPET